MDEGSVVRHLAAHLTPSIAECVDATLAETSGDFLHDRLRLALRRCLRAQARADGRPVLHAAVVQLDGVGLLLPGRTRAGKSSLAVALACERHAAVASDDVVLLDGSNATALGAPVSIRRDSPYREDAQALWYTDESERLLVRADDLGASAVLHDVPCHLLAFPSFGDSDEAVRLSPAATYCRLLASLVFPIDRAQLLQMADTAARLPSVEIRYRSSEQAIRYLDEALRWVSAFEPSRAAEVPSAELEGFGEAFTGFRFTGDQVVVLHPQRQEVVMLDAWPVGAIPQVQSWSALIGRRS